jgi:hypothetical protein
MRRTVQNSAAFLCTGQFSLEGERRLEDLEKNVGYKYYASDIERYSNCVIFWIPVNDQLALYKCGLKVVCVQKNIQKSWQAELQLLLAPCFHFPIVSEVVLRLMLVQPWLPVSMYLDMVNLLIDIPFE